MPLFEHLGQDYEANLRYVQNLFWHSVGQLFRETGKLISGQTEITGKSTIDFKDLTWMSTRLWNSRAYQYSNAKACVFSDCVLCLGKWEMIPLPLGRAKLNGIRKINYFREMNRIHGEPMELEWKIFPGFTTLGILEEIQKMMTELQFEPGNFKGRIIFMSMYNDIVWDKQGTKGRCAHNSQAVAQIVLVNFLAVIVLAWAWIRKEVVRN